MGLLDTVLVAGSQSQPVLNSAEAFAVIVLMATAPNGYLSVEQANSVTFVLSGIKLLKSYPQETIKSLVDKILSIFQGDNLNTLFNAARDALSQELRQAAFAVVTDLVFAEDVVGEEDKNFLKDLHQALGVPTEIAMQIMQVMLIKNRV
ncbi:MAG: tellurite resistance TerB family protein [Nostoc sp. ChiSLP02]|nr:tellurite resistance TerB family protein [Nostoc sp. DedSLP05]MDZ8097714.1 tellurite resistance TerB family protein [Nostoc sp. DedSLP01]MDZ8183799.1 tellurite resistance TerB family protein [Nostoc sp. ChiSLP02]